MRPIYWRPPIELSVAEQTIVKRIRRAKLFVFLRQHRHEVFDEAFQRELAGLYQESERGQPPVAPALLALATILQAYTGASDDEVIEASTMDRRWQLVLNCIDTEKSPFSKGTLIAFRKRLIEANMAERLVERTIKVARETGAFGGGSLRGVLERSPLWRASHVEDTNNLLGTPYARLQA
jgi:transposase